MENRIKGWEKFLKTIQLKSRKRTAYSELHPDVLADFFPELESLNVSPKNLYMNAKTFTAIRKWGRDIFDIETGAEAQKQGRMGALWGAIVWLSKEVPDHTVLMTSEGDTHGSILSLAEDIPGAKELVEMLAQLQSMSSTIQSHMYAISKHIESMVSKVEKIG